MQCHNLIDVKHHYFNGESDKQHTEKLNEVVSVLPLADTENPPETAAEKLKYLIQESKS